MSSGQVGTGRVGLLWRMLGHDTNSPDRAPRPRGLCWSRPDIYPVEVPRDVSKEVGSGRVLQGGPARGEHART